MRRRGPRATGCAGGRGRGDWQVHPDNHAGTSYRHEARDPGTDYAYGVVSYVGSEESGWSTAAEVTTPALPVPSGVVATATATAVTVTWDAVPVADAYQVWRQEMADGTSRVDVVRGTEHVDRAVSLGVEYRYQVRTLLERAGGDLTSTASLEVAATPELAAPAGLTATAESSSVIALAWEASEGAASYEFQWKESGAADWNPAADTGTGTSHRHTRRDAETEYAYQVRAASGTHRSGWSGKASARTLAEAAPAAPAGVAAEADSPFAVTVSWDAVEDADSYTVRGQKVGAGTWETMAASGTSASDGDLAPETSYRYQVQSVRGALRSDWSAEVEATTGEFTAPTEFSATAMDSTSMELTWEASPGTDLEYRVRWRVPGGNWTTRRVMDTSYTVTGLEADTLYDFRIVGYRRTGSRSWHRTDAVDIEARTGTQ